MERALFTSEGGTKKYSLVPSSTTYLLRRRTRGRSTEYLIKWESTALLTWEPAANLRGGNLAQDMRAAPYWSDLPAVLIDKYTKGLSPDKFDDDDDDADNYIAPTTDHLPAEVHIKLMKAMALSWCHAAGLDYLTHAALAIRHAGQVLNRVRRKAVDWQRPLTMLTGIVPTSDTLGIYGCDAMMWLHPDNRGGKHMPKSTPTYIAPKFQRATC